jgi:hypothetical protein
VTLPAQPRPVGRSKRRPNGVGGPTLDRPGRASYALVMSAQIDKIQRQLDQVPWLRGRGPVSYNSGQWVDETYHLLVTLFGEDAAKAKGFLEIVGEGAEARGWGLPLAPANQWGMQARLGRAEAFLQGLVREQRTTRASKA